MPCLKHWEWIQNHLVWAQVLVSNSFLPADTLAPLFAIFRDQGSAPVAFRPSNAFCDRFNLEPSKAYTYATHAEFDKFVTSVKKACDNVSTAFAHDWLQLVAVDRMFWMHHGMDMMNAQFQPLDFDLTQLSYSYGFKSSCPFSQTGRFYPQCCDVSMSALDTPYGHLYY